MAFDANLTPAYGQIISQLENRANLEGQRVSPFSVGTQVVKRVDEELTKGRDFAQKMKAEGKVLVDDGKIDEFLTDAATYSEPEALERMKASVMRVRGLYVKPELIEDIIKQEAFANTFEDPQKAAAVRTKEGLKAGAESVFPKPISPGGKQIQNATVDGKNYAIPMDIYLSATRSASETGRPWTDFVNLSAFGEPAYKPTPFTDPHDNEKKLAIGTESVKPLTGPRGKKEGVALRTQYNQLNAKEQKVLAEASDDVSKDTVAKKLRESSTELQAIKVLAESGNPAAATILPMRVIRGVGREVGNLSGSEVKAGGGNQAYWAKIQRWVAKGATGNLPKGDINDFVKLALIAEKANRRDLNREVNKYVSRTFKQFETQDVDPAVIKDAIGFGDAKISVVRPDGRNARIPVSQLAKAIERGYKLAE